MASKTVKAELTAQVVFMDTVENAGVARAWATRRGISLSQASREIFERGLAGIKPVWPRRHGGELTEAELALGQETALQYAPKTRESAVSSRVVVPGGRVARKRAAAKQQVAGASD
jgi:hypothetical protein